MARILIVDDSESVRDFIASLLQQHGHSIATAHDGGAALVHLRRHHFDVLITDIYMPGVDGLELILRCRESDQLPRLIVISAGGSRVDLLPAARIMGANRTLPKPFTGDQLLQALQEVLRMPPPRPVRTRRVHGTAAPHLTRR